MSITFSPTERHDVEGVNMANGNAYAVMNLLQMEADYCGRIHSSELIERIDSVVSVSDQVRNPEVSQKPGCATMIFCGRSEEYLLGRLQQLRELAIAHPGFISWG